MGVYRIRPPFAVHLVKIVTNKQPNGIVVKKRNEQSFFSDSDNNEIELSDADAKAHMHKLEPVDAAGKKFFDDYYKRQEDAARQRAASADGGPSIEERVSGAVIAALVQAGVIKASAAKGA